MEKLHLQIAEYISSLQSDEGIFDPLEKQNVKNGYSNAFFALLADRIYVKTGKIEWRERRRKAIEAELSAINKRFAVSGVFRWEFKNLALLSILYESEGRKSRDLEPELKTKLEDYLRSLMLLGSYQTNWFAMRGLIYTLRFNCFGNPKDRVKARKQIKEVLCRQTPEGFFWDTPENWTFQYHAYTTMLLCKFYTLDRSESLRKAIGRGLDTLKKFTDNEGDFNYYGRSQKQLFGYASAILAFSLGSKIFPKEDYDSYAKLILNFIEPHTRKMHIVMNKDQNLLSGWYRYNYLTDYLPFAGALLSEADKVVNFKRTKLPKFKEEQTFFPSLNLFVKRTKDYFICFSSAKSKISSQPTGLVHIYPKAVSTAGGPPFNLVKGYENHTQNYLGLATNNRTYKEGYMSLLGNSLKQSFNYGQVKAEFIWDFTKGVSSNIKVIPKTKAKVKLHYVSNNKLKSNTKTKKTGELLSVDGKMNIYESELIALDKPTTFSINLVSSKLMKPQKTFSYAALHSNYPIKSFFRYYLLAPVHFTKSFTKKLIFHPRDLLSMLKYNQARRSYETI